MYKEKYGWLARLGVGWVWLARLITCTGFCANQDLPVEAEDNWIGLLFCSKQLYNHRIQSKANLDTENIHLHLSSEQDCS